MIGLLRLWKENRLEVEPESYFNKASDSSLYRHLLHQSVRNLSARDWLLASLSERKVNKLDLELRAAFHLGITQLETGSRVPVHAAVMETVQLMEWAKKGYLKGMLNALLRRYEREREQWTEQLQKEPLHRQTSHPKWLVQGWEEQFGQGEAHNILKANQIPPNISLVLKPGIDKAAFSKYLEEEGMVRTTNPWILEQAQGLFDSSWFHEGAFFVQDMAAQKVVRLLQDLPKTSWLDACAAPGGKLFLAEWLYGGDIEKLVGMDLAGGRMKRLEVNHQRLQSKARLITGDALNPEMEEDFELILVDAPCSATGTIRKYPEIKWTRSPEDFERNQAEQLAILKALSAKVKPGGHLVYVTCSLERQENQDVAEKFLAAHGEFQLRPLAAGEEITTEGYFQALPSANQMGAFAAVFSRIN